MNFHVMHIDESGIIFPEKFFKNKNSLSTVYDPSYANQLASLYVEESFSQDRFRKILWEGIIKRAVKKYFWIDFFATIILWVSRDLFLLLRRRWRILLNKSDLSFSKRGENAKYSDSYGGRR